MTDVPAKPANPILVRQFLDPVKLRADVAYTLSGLSTAMSDQASLFIEYGRHQAAASRQVDDFELLLETTENTLYRKYRDEAKEAKEKVVVADLDRLIAAHPRVIQLKRAVNEAKQIESNCKTVVEAFRHRRDMLVQQGATDREERKGELRFLAAGDREAEIAARGARLMDLRRESH